MDPDVPFKVQLRLGTRALQRSPLCLFTAHREYILTVLMRRVHVLSSNFTSGNIKKRRRAANHTPKRPTNSSQTSGGSTPYFPLTNNDCRQPTTMILHHLCLFHLFFCYIHTASAHSDSFDLALCSRLLGCRPWLHLLLASFQWLEDLISVGGAGVLSFARLESAPCLVETHLSCFSH